MAELIPESLASVLIITFNEEDNISRVLDRLNSFEKIVAVDSYSTDKTIDILKSYPNVVINYHKFESFADQCNYGLTLLNSEWVLSLDADYIVTDDLFKEIQNVLNKNNPSSAAAYSAEFRFMVFGKPLLNDNTTARPILFKKNCGEYYNDGHAHRVKINGKIEPFKNDVLHDDRKSLNRWLNNQAKYSLQESEKLISLSSKELSFINKIRKTKIFAPFFVFFYCLIIKGLIFNGWRGWYYTLQRTLVEILFALRLVEKKYADKKHID